MQKFIQCKHRYGKRFPECDKLDENGKPVLDEKSGKPIRLPEVFLPEAEKNMVIMLSPGQIENLEQSEVFRALMEKGDYLYHDKMPESAKTDVIRLAEARSELEAARQQIAMLESTLKGSGNADELAAARTEIEQLKTSLAWLPELQAQLEASKAEVERLNGVVSNSEDAVGSLQKDLEETKKQLAEARSELEAALKKEAQRAVTGDQPTAESAERKE